MRLKDLKSIKIKLDGCKYDERRTDDTGPYYLLYTINNYYYREREKGDRNGKRV